MNRSWIALNRYLTTSLFIAMLALLLLSSAFYTLIEHYCASTNG